jgi:hypothetical protein
MGNRAVVQFIQGDRPIQAFYLHWNGGPESVYTFLSVLEDDYQCRFDAAPARFAQLVGNYFGGCLSLYPWENGAPIDEDNGVYRVDTAQRPWLITRALPLLNPVPSDPDAIRILTAEEVIAEREGAKLHSYNIDGELRKEIREKNDRCFISLQ